MIKSLKETIKKVDISLVLFFFGAVAGVLLLLSEPILRVYPAEAIAMGYHPKLVWGHFITDLVTFIGLGGMSVGFLVMYNQFKDKPVPLNAFLWMLAFCSGFGALVALTDALRMFAPLYWISMVVKILTCLLFLGSAISIWQAIPVMKKMKTPEEYKQLADQLNSLQETYKELKEKLK